MEEVLVLSAVRTPLASFMGNFKDIAAPRLGAIAIKEAVQRSQAPLNSIDEVLMGMVLSAGVGQAPARQAALFAGLSESTQCTTVNRVCGSGLKAVMWGSQMIQCNDAQYVVAGGMESMTRAPYLLERAREGYRLGNGKLLDSMVSDGLWDPYNNIHMGNCAELCAKEKHISREDQDRFAAQSYQRALDAIQSGKFKDEIVPVPIQVKQVKKETKLMDTDEDPFKSKLDRLHELKPAFDKEGTITAGNASTIADGAAALVLSSRAGAEKIGAKPLARILGQESHAQSPQWFTTAPVGAVQKLLKKTGFSAEQIDLYEINEAFSVVALVCIRELRLDEKKVNIHGGAVSLGHPIGASGARILTTLIHALRSRQKRYGVATLCIGGGEASAVLVEVLH